jgi:uncharacterized protein
MHVLPARAIEARDSVIHGSGVYAREPIEAGAVIIEYTGERISLDEAARRERDRQARAERGEEACDYLYILDETSAIDGRSTSNVARLINHSCEANCHSDIVDGRVWIVASQDLGEGDEITFDYGYTYRDGLGHPCRCGKPSCVGFIVAKHQRWRVRRWLRQQVDGPRVTRNR